MAEKKPPAHEVAMKKIAEVCATMKQADASAGQAVHVGEVETRGTAFAEMLRDSHIPRQHHPGIARQLGPCGVQSARYLTLGRFITELQVEFAKTPACLKCGTGLEDDGSCQNPTHSVDPSIRVVVEPT